MKSTQTKTHEEPGMSRPGEVYVRPLLLEEQDECIGSLNRPRMSALKSPGASKASDTPDNGVAKVGDKGPQVYCADPVGGPYNELIDAKIGVLPGSLQSDGS